LGSPKIEHCFTKMISMESSGLQAPATRDGCAFLSLGFEVRAITGC